MVSFHRFQRSLSLSDFLTLSIIKPPIVPCIQSVQMFYSTLLTCSGNFLCACIPFSHSLVHLYFQVEELFSVANNGTNVETRLVNEHLYKALKGSRFHLMDITHMSEFRADAHPATAGGKKHDDCMHWCLPGITDTWNDMLVAHLLTINRS